MTVVFVDVYIRRFVVPVALFCVNKFYYTLDGWLKRIETSVLGECIAAKAAMAWNSHLCDADGHDKMATRCQQQCENIFVALFLDDKMGYM